MQRVGEKTHSRGHYHWSPMLPIALVIGLAVVGALSVRQHQALELLRRTHVDGIATQGEQLYLLLGRLTQLQRQFDRQIALLGPDLQNGSAQLAKITPETEQTLRELAGDVTELNQQVRQLAKETLPADLKKELALLSQQIDQSQHQVAQVMASSHWTEKTVADMSGGVCLIQGEYTFVDPASGKPLRYEAPLSSSTNESKLTYSISELHEKGAYPVSVEGQGDTLAVQYTATGFLIDKRGYLITNKHVTTPWDISPDYKHVLAAGYQPHLKLFRAFFPGQPQPFDLQVARSDPDEDVALLHVDLNGADVPVLPCQSAADTLKVGQTVIVLGYPTGFDVLLARMTTQELDDVVGSDGASFNTIALRMAAQSLIEPVATRGMCGRVSTGKIIYDAQTTIGGSGAPVLAANAKVVAINTALMKGFTGSNFGIPVQRGLDLLAAHTSENVNLASGTEPVVRH